MPKINQEEYEILKGLDDQWKWIARDRVGLLYAFGEKPYKYNRMWLWRDNGVFYLFNGTGFQFIQWEDEEPYSIQELIDEYLDDEYGYFNMKLSREFEEFIKKESEETEVKNIKWFMEQMKSMTRMRDTDSDEESWYISEDSLLEALNQLDEPEVKQLDEKIRELESYNDELIRDNNQLRNAMDNQETLSQEWIGNNVLVGYPYDEYQVVPTEKLQKLLVPKQSDADQAYKDGYEKGKEHGYKNGYSVGFSDSTHDSNEPLGNPQQLKSTASEMERVRIPQFVADYIDDRKEINFPFYQAIRIVRRNSKFEDSELRNWLWTNTNQETFARAWLDGYTIEEEPKYYVLIGEKLYFAGWNDVVATFTLDDAVGSLEDAQKFVLEDGNKTLGQIGCGRLVEVAEQEE